MGIPFKEYLQRIDSDEINQQIVLEQLDPMDAPWKINALNCLVTASAAGAKNVKLEDFMPETGDTETKKKLKLMNAALALEKKKRREELGNNRKS